ncbi:hypothetical protein IHE45_14G044400 [Dioscorea alata]|uniref:Uncharacterized protein n=1 Tax=Dioscorea alata TaxID=55571 RepID=A0ACB7URN0_DIOAL|nr:hypothetical protein IHE45_14G044400 [Dioscorea alata]
MQIGIDFQGQEKILSLRELWVLVDTFGSTIILMQQKIGQSLQAFLQWKTLVSLFLCCTEAVSTCVMFYFKFRSIKVQSSLGVYINYDDGREYWNVC